MSNPEYCFDCELDFGSARDDGSKVVRVSERPICSRCEVKRDNADEQAWIDHETDKVFGYDMDDAIRARSDKAVQR